MYLRVHFHAREDTSNHASPTHRVGWRWERAHLTAFFLFSIEGGIISSDLPETVCMYIVTFGRILAL